MLKVGDRVGVSKKSIDAFSWIGRRKPRADEYARIHRIFKVDKRIVSIEVEFDHLPGIYFSVRRENVFKVTRY